MRISFCKRVHGTPKTKNAEKETATYDYTQFLSRECASFVTACIRRAKAGSYRAKRPRGSPSCNEPRPGWNLSGDELGRFWHSVVRNTNRIPSTCTGRITRAVRAPFELRTPSSFQSLTRYFNLNCLNTKYTRR